MQKKNIIIGAILLVVIIVSLFFVFKKNRGKDNFRKNMIEKREERMERNRNLEEGEVEVIDKEMEKPVEQQDDNMGNDLEELRKNEDQLDKEIDDLETSDF